MIDGPCSRRELLQAAGGIGFAGVPDESDSRPAADESLEPAQLLVSPAVVPAHFEVVSASDPSPLMRAFRQSDPVLERSAAAGQGWAAGDDLQNPEWVVSTLAVVCEEPPHRDATDTAIYDCGHEYVDSYGAEFRPDIQCDPAITRRPQSTEFRLELSLDPFYLPDSVDDTDFVDVFRVQYCGSVLLATLVFGPQESTPSVDTRLTRFARIQREQFHSTVRES